MRAKSMTRGYALAPTMIIFGWCSSAISSRPVFCRCSSSRIAPAISGSASASVRQSGTVVSTAMCLLLADLIEPALMAPALVFGPHPQLQDFIRETEGDDAAAHGEDV